MPMLETETVRLRALELSDVDNLYLWENDTDIWSVSQTYAPFSKAVLSAFIESQKYDIYHTHQLRMVIERKDTCEAVGAIDIFDFDPHNARAGVGIVVYEKSFRGKGYGRQALELVLEYSRKVLCLHQLYCDVFTDNIASAALFRSAGFQSIGIKKSWSRAGAEWRDVEMFQYIF